MIADRVKQRRVLERRRVRPLRSLIDDAIAGDRTAIEAIYSTYAGRIRAFAIGRGCHDPDALTNDVMLKALQHLSTFQGDEEAFVRWIFAIARNRLIDFHRQRGRRRESTTRSLPDRAIPSAEETAVQHLGIEAVVEMLEVLTVEQREVVTLRLIEDLSLSDVAEIVGRPVTAVKALQRRGLRRLQRELRSQGVA